MLPAPFIPTSVEAVCVYLFRALHASDARGDGYTSPYKGTRLAGRRFLYDQVSLIALRLAGN